MTRKWLLGMSISLKKESWKNSCQLWSNQGEFPRLFHMLHVWHVAKCEVNMEMYVSCSWHPPDLSSDIIIIILPHAHRTGWNNTSAIPLATSACRDFVIVTKLSSQKRPGTFVHFIQFQICSTKSVAIFTISQHMPFSFPFLVRQPSWIHPLTRGFQRQCR